MARQVKRLPWIGIACVGLVIALRAVWLGAPLGNDEGGLAYVAQHWEAGDYVYGEYFIDRPPVLLAIFRLATLIGGTEAIRILGLICALALCGACSMVATRLSGPAAGRWAALISAALGSSIVLGAVFTPAELIAAVPATFSVLLLLGGLDGDDRRLTRFAGAGGLAVLALLVKQSFGDALLAGVAGISAACFVLGDLRERFRDAAAYAAGGALVAAGFLIWHLTGTASTSDLIYALLGFRLDVNDSWTGTASEQFALFADRAGVSLLASGMILIVLWAIRGWLALRGRSVIWIAVAAWAAGGLAGVLAGNSYWNHYLIQLVPFASVAAAVALSQTRKVLALATGVVLGVAVLGGVAAGERLHGVEAETEGAAEVGHALDAAARERDSAYVMYSQANVLYYSGLQSPYPYNWSLMIRSIPGAPERLRALLSSPRRPDWIVLWESPDAYGLDPHGRTAALLRRHYERAGSPCGKVVMKREELDRNRLREPHNCP